MKKVAMIPARLGSKRVKKKNLRLIDGKPMIAYIIEAAKSSGCFDEIYINSESDVFGKIAEEYGVEFYKRPEKLSSDTATNDEFALDFIENIECDTLYQLLPTSPFVSPEDIRGFVDAMEDGLYKTMVSVKHAQISCVFDGEEINFDRYEPLPPSQEVVPVKVYATALMAWDTETFKSDMSEHGSAYHGSQHNTGYYELKGYSTIDVDNEDDFILAEAVAEAIKTERKEPEYYNPDKKERVEVDVPSILAKDGVVNNDLFDSNNERVSIKEIIANNPKTESWSKRLVDTENNSATLISQMPGEGNRMHYHDNWNEWWYILGGEWEWTVEGREIIVKKGDLVFIEKGKKHKIIAIGEEPAVRLAVSRADVNHIYEENE
jgi:CMP-N-acetylneuraminic acid synthetase/quercetin dioxygenase-like cupin family protein